ncbi:MULTISPECIES: lanthionine synthetase LanC family protein [unclassified Arcicella]|uniref:lanthionine synthetase LanC family protein n=1 Tax=unclassified Arcicella TaxID=2644986 RepID=UPI00285FE2A9|nr:MULTISPECIES: lanthionine synthetase LanC family protein [unclassified Arcicella]MDR6562168.1 lantibiotic modifying enzyme [Arcicella sp. BE51]MDR6812137.1 lantibiotic modifying enzyme [Arcicella sp. BE140]MDR6823449.1 lantibiotic modifying enzyme [Arcicella sp. BE139]
MHTSFEIETDIDLIEHHLEDILGLIEADKSDKFSLFRGNIGKALFYSYAFKYTNDINHGMKAIKLIEKSANHLLTGQIKAQNIHLLSTGFTGFGLVINQLKRDEIFDLELEKELAAFDSVLYNTALQEIQQGNVGFMLGPMAAVYYLSQRTLANPAIEKYLETIVDALWKVAIRDDKGLRYINTFSSTAKPRLDDTVLNLNHGFCGIALVLLEIYRLGICQSKIYTIVNEGIHFLLSCKRPIDFAKGHYSFFPTCIDEQSPIDSEKNQLYYHAILGWCNGDLNQILLLYTAGKAFKNQSYINIAEEVGLASMLRKTPEQTKLKNPYFCHGTSGVAHIYKRIAERSGNDAYLSAHNYWIQQTFDYITEAQTNNSYVESAGHLIDGAMGIGLSLLSHISEEELKWDNLLLL